MSDFLDRAAALRAARDGTDLTPPTPPTGGGGDGSLYGQRALHAEIERVENAPEGTRNAALNRAAFSLGQLIAGGVLREHDVVDALARAALQNGLLASEIKATLRSGIEGGKKTPRGVPAPRLPTQRGPLTAVPDNIDPATGEILPERQPNPLPALDLDLLSEPCPEPDWLIEGRMTRQSLTLLGSKPGIGKSWTSLDLALALTTGRTWLGHTIPGRARVLYIDVENGETLARRRLQQLGADPALIGGRLHYVTEAVIFPGGDDSRRYADTLDQFQPDLVIIDTLASSAPSAESDTESMSLFLSDVWHRARAAGAACLILAHLRKSQQGAGKDDPLDSFRGAGHLVGAASRAWLLEPRGAEHFVLRDVKTREFPACPTVHVRLLDEATGPGAIVPKLTSVVMDGIDDDDVPPEMQFQKDALEFIDNHPLKVATTSDLKHVGASIGMAEKTVSNLLSHLVKQGVLERPGGKAGNYARSGLHLIEGA